MSTSMQNQVQKMAAKIVKDRSQTLVDALRTAKSMLDDIPVTEDWKQSVANPLDRAIGAAINLDGTPSSMIDESADAPDEGRKHWMYPKKVASGKFAKTIRPDDGGLNE